MQRRKPQKQNLAALQNKIRNDLLVVGKSALLELIVKFPREFDYIVYSGTNDQRTQKIINLAISKGVQTIQDRNLVQQISNLEGSDFGVCGVLKREVGKTYSYKDIAENFDDMDSICCVAFTDMDYEQNLGAMLRTCAGLGVDFVIVPNSQQKIFSTTITKISMGYNYLIPVVKENFLLALDNLAKSGFDVVGLDMDGENIQNMRYNPRVCFVVGNEAKGLSQSVLGKTNKKVSIPMQENVESLNVSVSLGIALYDYYLKKAIQIPIE